MYRAREKGGKIPFSAWLFCVFSRLYSCIQHFLSPSSRFVFYFSDTQGVLQQFAVTASHLQVNEASMMEEGRVLASLL